MPKIFQLTEPFKLAVRGAVLCICWSVFAIHAAEGFQCRYTMPCKLACGNVCRSNVFITSSEIGALGNQSDGADHGSSSAASRNGVGTIRAARLTAMMDELIDKVIQVAEQQYSAATSTFQPGQYPGATTATGAWEAVPPGHWVSGCFVGVLWRLHALTGKSSWSTKALEWQQALADKQRYWHAQHDLGFIYQPSFVNSYAMTGALDDLRQALAAAEALAWAYNPGTKSLRTFEGWEPAKATHNYKQIVIIDFMMNIQLLVWGSKNVGSWQGLMDTNPREVWLDMAISHARQVAANHIRPDGSTYHIVEYHPDTGAVNAKYTYQGYADNSTWARGQSWAIAGFAMLHQETGLPEFLQTAQQVADKWLQLLNLQQQSTQMVDYVPVWDFNAPYDPENDGPRDTSAAAVAALGLLHLAEAMPHTLCGEKYLCAAVNTLRALASPKYLATPGGGFAALLKHATGNWPANVQIDVGLVYGDYYFLTALQKCASMEGCRRYSS